MKLVTNSLKVIVKNDTLNCEGLLKAEETNPGLISSFAQAAHTDDKTLDFRIMAPLIAKMSLDQLLAIEKHTPGTLNDVMQGFKKIDFDFTAVATDESAAKFPPSDTVLDNCLHTKTILGQFGYDTESLRSDNAIINAVPTLIDDILSGNTPSVLSSNQHLFNESEQVSDIRELFFYKLRVEFIKVCLVANALGRAGILYEPLNLFLRQKLNTSQRAIFNNEVDAFTPLVDLIRYCYGIGEPDLRHNQDIDFWLTKDWTNFQQDARALPNATVLSNSISVS